MSDWCIDIHEVLRTTRTLIFPPCIPSNPFLRPSPLLILGYFLFARSPSLRHDSESVRMQVDRYPTISYSTTTPPNKPMPAKASQHSRKSIPILPTALQRHDTFVLALHATPAQLRTAPTSVKPQTPEKCLQVLGVLAKPREA